MKGGLVKMRRSVEVCFLLSGLFLLVSAFSHFYMARSVGLLPVINYSLRPYTVPLMILGFLFLFSGITLHKFFSESK